MIGKSYFPKWLDLAVAAGGFSYRNYEPGSAAHRRSGNYKPTEFDLMRIERAKQKRARKKYREHILMQNQRCREFAARKLEQELVAA